jgi:hypothetical protein
MGEDATKIPLLNIKQQQYLSQIWLNITYALVLTGHTTDLCQALSAASTESVQTSLAKLLADTSAAGIGRLELHRFTTQNFVPPSGTPTTNQYSINSSWNRDLSAGGPRSQSINDYPSNLLSGTICDNQLSVCDGHTRSNHESDGDTIAASDSEGSDDYDMDDLLEIPPDLVSDSADLSQYYGDNLPQTSEDMDIEELFPALHVSSISNASAFADAGLQSPGGRHKSTQPRVILPNSESYEPFNAIIGPDNTAGQHAQCLPGSTDNTCSPEQSSQSIARKKRKVSVKATKGVKRMSLPTSAKKDLTSAEISPVAKNLLRDNAISFFHKNSPSISKTWISSIKATTAVSVIEPLVRAFDEVHRWAGNTSMRLRLRFSYIQLIWAIDTLKVAATKDRLYSYVRRKPGYRNTSLAIDIYLYAKRNTSGEILSRSQLSEYMRISRR